MLFTASSLLRPVARGTQGIVSVALPSAVRCRADRGLASDCHLHSGPHFLQNFCMPSPLVVSNLAMFCPFPITRAHISGRRFTPPRYSGRRRSELIHPGWHRGRGRGLGRASSTLRRRGRPIVEEMIPPLGLELATQETFFLPLLPPLISSLRAAVWLWCTVARLNGSYLGFT